MRHLACIMDGNRRWARAQNMEIMRGHHQGAKVIQTVSQFCIDNTIPYLSLYTFSLENFKRSALEQNFIFSLLNDEGKKILPHLVEQKIRMKFIGARDLFPEATREIIQELEEKTKHYDRLQINLLFCYGSRQEIVETVKEIVRAVQKGFLKEEDISEKTFNEYLWTHNIPEPDLIIRTGGAVRLSNFLLYQAAYSELFFLDCLWPDINEHYLQKAIDHFHNAKRNFGG